MMRRTLFTIMVAAIAMTVGCGGSSKPAKGANDSMDTLDSPREGELSGDDVNQPDLKKSDPNASKSDEDESRSSRGAKKKQAGNDTDDPKNNPDPEFKEGGSVEDAINAVPQGLPRENIDQDVLDKPLLDMSRYSACKLGPSHHFEIKFAVWNGRIVGMDIKSTPKSAKLEECVRNAAMKATWRDKSKSLNISTVMF
jgi:hypothetical protein